MQLTVNVPDDLPMNIVQQHIHDLESKLTLISRPNEQPPTVSIKRGSAKHIITFIADDFNAPLELVEKKPFNPKQFFGVSHLKKIDQQLEEMCNEWKR